MRITIELEWEHLVNWIGGSATRVGHLASWADIVLPSACDREHPAVSPTESCHSAARS